MNSRRITRIRTYYNTIKEKERNGGVECNEYYVDK